MLRKLTIAIFAWFVVGENIRYDVGADSYIANTLENNDATIQKVFSGSRNFADLPPIIPRPQKKERTIEDGELPRYVIDYAPLVHLYSEERYLPYDVQEYVTNFHVRYENGSIVPGTENDMNIHKLSELKDSHLLYLTANSDFDSDPDWITGIDNKPNLINGEIKDAPATLIIVDKGNGWVDAFWFYFYSFNLGPFVMGQGPYGNHVGDWEHSLVRFYKGEPKIVWMSAHGGGGGFFYKNLEKYALDARHPIIFSARGTHANYASVGQHPHDLPYEILSDFTDRGPLWNPSKNYLGYTYDGRYATPVKENSVPKHVGRELRYGNWLAFRGHWGDKQLEDHDPRQMHSIIGGYKYISGPTGPLMKNLLRVIPCERAKWWNFWNGCTVRSYIKWGVGVESEGYNCGTFLMNLKPDFLRKILQRLSWGGGFCYIVDLLYG